MGHQTFDWFDYMGPVVVGVVFASTLFVLSLIINCLCITKEDEVTMIEKWGARRNVRLGRHRLSVARAAVDRGRFKTDS